jgi:NADPH-dependent 2,4-dienoyl-CoA reductase/sulfur reductase-like enzyme
MSADEHVEGGLTLADACRIAGRLEAAGIDLIDVSAGIYESAPWIVQPMEMAQGCLAPLAREIRRHVGIPVSVAGRLGDASVAEHVLEAGDADFVTLGRALHADPEMPRKSREGREDEVCACVGCLKCSDLLGQNEPVLCLANTHTGRERQYAIRRTPRPQRVLVVGAGPAGLEAARVLALRGHAVTVLERGSEPGGQLRLARLVPGRGDLAGWRSTWRGRRRAREPGSTWASRRRWRRCAPGDRTRSCSPPGPAPGCRPSRASSRARRWTRSRCSPGRAAP